jgi:uncharacterized protein YwgA
MTRYQLAKLISWAGTLHSRKRMQKVVFMLKAAGFPTDAEYRLHHFGPYSDDVAHLADEMTQADLLDEHEDASGFSNSYDYRLSAKANAALVQFEATPRGESEAAALAAHHGLAMRLFEADLKDLEYAATLVYFRKRGAPWPEAIDKTCEFKKLRKKSLAIRRAEALAREIDS